ncbi:MAG: shikimate dehydrogenase [Bacillota bacterium]|nr:shikimate dehydrogenase [Bacillota bacterium]
MTLEELKKSKASKKLYGLIGFPLGHSVSPGIHMRYFESNGVDAGYILAEIPPDKLEAAVPVLREKLAGFNCTIPHKERIVPFLDALDDSARYGAVNTVKNEGGKLIGYNTDGEGFLAALERAKIETGRKRVLLLGAGGVARTIAYLLAERGARIDIFSLEYAETLARDIKLEIENARIAVTGSQDMTGFYDLLVNATPSGMYPKVNAMPVGDETIKNCGAVYDAVYNPIRTKLVLRAQKHGARAEGGLAMLVFQAAAAQRIWTGCMPPLELTEEIIRQMEKMIPREFPICIVLFGFMGSGKTAVGKILAGKLEMDFHDLDAEIEKNTGMTIPEIFERYGEEAFRRMEHELLSSFVYQKSTVLAVGGGALASKENIKALENTPCTAVFLQASMENMLRRVDGGKGRPMLSGEDMEKRARALYEKRLPSYLAAADVIVNADAAPEETAEKIIHILALT